MEVGLGVVVAVGEVGLGWGGMSGVAFFFQKVLISSCIRWSMYHK